MGIHDRNGPGWQCPGIWINFEQNPLKYSISIIFKANAMTLFLSAPYLLESWLMDLTKRLRELRIALKCLEEAIIAFLHLRFLTQKRGGRPRKTTTEAEASEEQSLVGCGLAFSKID